jgi:hypothetical protein
MKRFILIVSLVVLSWSVAEAQGGRKKAFIPKDDAAEYDEDLEEEVRMETQIMQSQPTDKEQQRMIRHREKRKDKEYKKHHKEIQDKKTRKKMKKDKKKSEAYNHHKPPLKSKRAAKKRDRKR